MPIFTACPIFYAVPKPNLDSYIFLRANERQEQILIEPELEDEQK